MIALELQELIYYFSLMIIKSAKNAVKINITSIKIKINSQEQGLI